MQERTKGAVSICSNKMTTSKKSKHLIQAEPSVYSPQCTYVTGKVDNKSDYGEPVRENETSYQLPVNSIKE